VKETPKISVVTPTLNCGQFIRDCIESVLAQNYENFEHIIVDGGSADGTVDVLREYPHLTWVSDPDDGEVFALNKALKMASGDIIGWLNADDWYRDGVF
jgi:glycosyltransferase involved in cell wall biosynthesis